MITLQAAALAAWAMLSPSSPSSVDAPAVADAIEFAVTADLRGPLTTSKVRDAVMMAVYAKEESGVLQHPHCLSWDCKAGVSCGVWQMPCSYVRKHTLREQAAHWIEMFRMSRTMCPSVPGAVMCGSCAGSLPRRIATHRWVVAREFARKIEVM